MIYASVCDGIGAAHAAWKPLGWRCAWTSEIERFPIAVVDHHYGLPNLGDMTKITEADVEKHGRIDLLVGGTPCQSFSVAGLRGGMADPRGNLALRFIQLAGTLRPAWVVWENVPGVLSSNEGRDFGAFLGALGQLGYGWAYRVLDARYFGVPQRRRRPFVVGYLGDWRRAASVLLERESMCGHPPPCGEAAKDIANTVGAGAGERGYEPNENYIPSVSCALKSRDHKGPSSDGDGDGDGDGAPLIAHALRADGHDGSEDGTGRGTPIVAFNWQAGGSKAMVGGTNGYTDAMGSSQIPAIVRFESLKPNGVRHTLGHADAAKTNAVEALRTLLSEVGEEVVSQWCVGVLAALWPQEVLRSGVYGKGVRREAVSYKGTVYLSLALPEAGEAGSVRALWEAGCVGCPPSGWGCNKQRARELGAYLSLLPHSPSPAEAFMLLVWEAGEGLRLLRQALSAIQEARRSECRPRESASEVQDLSEASPLARPVRCALHATSQVRRITVEEAEALQGFPRGYTQVPYRGKPAADAPRYKALGNSMAVPCMAWIGNRIATTSLPSPPQCKEKQ